MTDERPAVDPERESVAVALRAASARLAAGSETPRLDAEVLLRHVLGLDRTALFVQMREPLGAADRAAFEALVERRLAGEPVAYLTGGREFMGLPFAVRPGVLVPRPETEGLVEWVLGRLVGRLRGTVVDVGTGSG
ncbi:MAG: protein-(glutamine-N5) methyltransferase, release factor-specific, partial [Chloroflexota bacterium]|nr:protein-(glutamine-N5) methyltransferase, release factor-specific [Chloroflexota bacterium]